MHPNQGVGPGDPPTPPTRYAIDTMYIAQSFFLSFRKTWSCPQFWTWEITVPSQLKQENITENWTLNHILVLLCTNHYETMVTWHRCKKNLRYTIPFKLKYHNLTGNWKLNHTWVRQRVNDYTTIAPWHYCKNSEVYYSVSNKLP